MLSKGDKLEERGVEKGVIGYRTLLGKEILMFEIGMVGASEGGW